MSDALRQLNEAIEAARNEAKAEGYREGFAAAMAQLQAFMAQQAPYAQPSALAGTYVHVDPTGQVALPPLPPPPSGRNPRGENKRQVLNALIMLGGKRGATAIQQHLTKLGSDLAYSSVRNALSQLVRDGEVLDVGSGEYAAKSETPPKETKEGALI